LTPFTIVLALFLLYFVGFLAWVFFSQWLVLWTGDLAIAVAVVAAIGVFVIVAVALARISSRIWGFIIAASMILFWSFVVFEVSGTARIFAFVIAGVLLFAGVAVAITDYVTMLRPAAPRSTPSVRRAATERSVVKR
jgi:hypothetical protein